MGERERERDRERERERRRERERKRMIKMYLVELNPDVCIIVVGGLLTTPLNDAAMLST